MVTVLKRVRIKTTERRLEIIMPSSKQGVKSYSLRRETASQPSLSLQIAIQVLDDKPSSSRVQVAGFVHKHVAKAWQGFIVLIKNELDTDEVSRSVAISNFRLQKLARIDKKLQEPRQFWQRFDPKFFCCFFSFPEATNRNFVHN